MEKKYVTLDIAIGLKNMGFDEPCEAYYRLMLGSNEPIFHKFTDKKAAYRNSELVGATHTYYSAPTYDVAMRFIHEREQSLTKWTHPEMKEGEVLVINVKEGENWNKPSFIEYLRLGEVAYTTNGERIVEGMNPLFGKLKK